MEHPYREAAERAYHAFRYPMLAFVVIMLVGTAGYWEVSAGKATLLDCAYMTFITIATIGYGEVIDLSASPGGRVFTMVIGFLGVANVFYMTSKMTAFIVESDLNEGLRRHRMHRDIETLAGHYIVCGIGRVGTNVLRELVATGRESVVIEPAQPSIEAMLESYPKQRYLHGDGADDELLRVAGVQRAAGHRLRGTCSAPRRPLGIQSGRGAAGKARQHADRHDHARRACEARATGCRVSSFANTCPTRTRSWPSPGARRSGLGSVIRTSGISTATRCPKQWPSASSAA